MNSTINATVREIRPTRDVTAKFSIQEIVVESTGDYPQKFMLQFVNDKIALVDDLNVGDLCDFNVNLRGSEWTPTNGETKYFTNLSCWSLMKLMSPSTAPAIKTKTKATRLPSNPLDIKGRAGNIESNFQEDAIDELNNEYEDDLPF